MTPARDALVLVTLAAALALAVKAAAHVLKDLTNGLNR